MHSLHPPKAKTHPDSETKKERTLYRVLKPEFEMTGERTMSGQPVYRVKAWLELGVARDMQDAKRLHPAPVLEPITKH